MKWYRMAIYLDREWKTKLDAYSSLVTIAQHCVSPDAELQFYQERD